MCLPGCACGCWLCYTGGGLKCSKNRHIVRFILITKPCSSATIRCAVVTFDLKTTQKIIRSTLIRYPARQLCALNYTLGLSGDCTISRMSQCVIIGYPGIEQVLLCISCIVPEITAGEFTDDTVLPAFWTHQELAVVFIHH